MMEVVSSVAFTTAAPSLPPASLVRVRYTRYDNANFVDSVFPAPDSPEMMIDWLPPPLIALR